MRTIVKFDCSADFVRCGASTRPALMKFAMKALAVGIVCLTVGANAVAQTGRSGQFNWAEDRDFDRMQPGTTPTNKYRLTPSQNKGAEAPEQGRYALLSDEQIEYLRSRPEIMQKYGDDLTHRVFVNRMLNLQAENDIRMAKIMLNSLGVGGLPKFLIVTDTMLKALNMTADYFNKLNAETRFHEVCRYRIALYRKDGIALPQECLNSK